MKYPRIFITIFDRVIAHEGGFTNNPKDPGNWTGGKVGSGELLGTKWGLAAHTYPDLDIENITKEEAMTMYWKWYLRCDLNSYVNSMQYQVFDAAFTHGMKWAVRLFQRTVGVDDDGIAGPKTRRAAMRMSENDKLLRFIGFRTKFFTDLKHFDEFGRGWTRRISQNLLYAAEDNKEV